MTPSPFVPATLSPEHIGLYVHIPFCARKCRYCDFASQALGAHSALPAQYLDALAQEASRRREARARPLHSIFIGGGTPSLLNGAQLRRLWHEIINPIPRIADAEITVEINPGTLTDDVLAALAEMPLTRVSLGAQSAHADELALLGRIHTPGEVGVAVAALRDIGVPQINIDLMYALPGQSVARWEATLRHVLALQPDHLSCYALILEDGTPLAAQVAAGELPAPDEEEEERMIAISHKLLAEAGFVQYEVSNYARPGAVCRHNLGYWLGREYLGLGAAAASTIGGVRWRNADEIETYLALVAETGQAATYLERLSAPERLLELVMLGLRLRDGFNLAAAEAASGVRLRDIAGTAFHALQDEQLLVFDGRILRLSTTGYPLANTVVARLMAAVEAGRAMHAVEGER